MRICPWKVWRSMVSTFRMKRVLSEWVTLLLLTPHWSLLIKMSLLFSGVHQCQQIWVLHLTSTFSLSVSPSKISSDYIWADYGIAFSSLKCTCEIKKKFFKLISLIYTRKSVKATSIGCIHLKAPHPKKSCYKYTWLPYSAFYIKLHPYVFKMGYIFAIPLLHSFVMWLEIYWYSALLLFRAAGGQYERQMDAWSYTVKYKY